jgi:hypothetical protein
MPFGAMIEVTIQVLQQIFNVKTQRSVGEGLYSKVCLISHTMHIDYKWNILLLDLDCHLKS